MKRELLLFAGLFLFLALSMHFSAWMDHPLAHIEALPHSSLGVYHPLFLTLIVYGVIALLRGLWALIKKFRG